MDYWATHEGHQGRALRGSSAASLGASAAIRNVHPAKPSAACMYGFQGRSRRTPLAVSKSKGVLMRVSDLIHGYQTDAASSYHGNRGCV